MYSVDKKPRGLACLPLMGGGAGAAAAVGAGGEGAMCANSSCTAHTENVWCSAVQIAPR
jgi:hypothetical protein